VSIVFNQAARIFGKNVRGAHVLLWASGVVLLICVLRFLFFYAAFVQDPALPIDPDSMDYIEPALSLLKNGTYADGFGNPSFRRPPGYAAIVAGLYALFGAGNLLAVVIFQNLVFFASSILVVLIAFWMGGLATMVIAAALFLSHFITFYYSNEVLNETIFTFLVLLSVVCLVASVQAKRIRLGWILSAGTILTAATFVRPVSLYLFYPLALLLAIFAFQQRKNWPDAAKACAVFFLPWIILGGLWYARNLQELGHFQFVGQQSEVLRERSTLLIARIENIPEPEVVNFYQKHVGENTVSLASHLKFYNRYPFQYLGISMESVLVTLFSPAQWHYKFYFPDYPRDREAFTSHILLGDFPAVLRAVGSWDAENILLLIGILFHSVILVVGALIPLVVSNNWRLPNFKFLGFSYLVIFYMLILVFLWGGSARFNVPNIPFLAILAGYGYASLFQSLFGVSLLRKLDSD
jgi:4-amino-4-deoxy-L-arabinose transferase-like glycosyltransferase